MKLILDIKDAVNYIPAVNAAQMAQQQFPDQEIGSKGVVKLNIRNQEFKVTRNADSYMVKVTEEEDTLG